MKLQNLFRFPCERAGAAAVTVKPKLSYKEKQELEILEKEISELNKEKERY